MEERLYPIINTGPEQMMEEITHIAARLMWKMQLLSVRNHIDPIFTEVCYQEGIV